MRALVVTPGSAGSARVADVPEPSHRDGQLLVRGIAIGICGTDAEIVGGEYGQAPDGERDLVLGHESLGEVIEAPHGSGFAPGDRIAGAVRRPDPEPCRACAAGEWDFCLHGRYTERGIKGRHGYGAQRWRVEPEFAVAVDPKLGSAGVLVETASVVAKAWEQIDRVGARSAAFAPQRALVTGAGPVGLMAALLATQRGLDVHVLDRVTDGPKPQLVGTLGATYHADGVDSVPEVDVAIETTGVGEVIFTAAGRVGPGGVVCLTGLSPSGRFLRIDAGALNQELVLENAAIVGSVNANLRHYAAASAALAAADVGWLHALITRTEPLDRFDAALAKREHDVKVVLELD